VEHFCPSTGWQFRDHPPTLAQASVSETVAGVVDVLPLAVVVERRQPSQNLGSGDGREGEANPPR
jgi:hypothetical protein